MEQIKLTPNLPINRLAEADFFLGKGFCGTREALGNEKTFLNSSLPLIYRSTDQPRQKFYCSKAFGNELGETAELVWDNATAEISLEPQLSCSLPSRAPAARARALRKSSTNYFFLLGCNRLWHTGGLTKKSL